MREAEGLTDPIAIALEVGGILEGLGARYLVGGSLASSLHGDPRSTLDVDLVTDLQLAHLDGLLSALSAAYYVDRDAATEAIRSGTSFNAIHRKAAMKVDLFVAGGDAFELERLALRMGVPVRPGATLWVDIPEHSVLRKLEWYRRGGEVSERQWRDVLGVVEVQGDRLDRTRLLKWSAILGVEDLLLRVLDPGSAPRADG